MASPFNLSEQNTQVDSKVVAALERVAQAFRVLLWQEGKAFGLSPIQIQLLIFIQHHHDSMCKVSYLAQEFNMTKPTISDAVKALERKGLVKKVAEVHDTRSQVILLTAKGKAIVDKTATFSTPLQQSISQLPPAQQATMLAGLTEVIAYLNRTGIISMQRMCSTCAHYRRQHEGASHYCALMDQPLAKTELRLDCPEHEPSDAPSEVPG